MKKRLLACIAVLLVMCAYNKASAQITGVQVDSAMAWTQSTCMVPTTGYFMEMGWVAGTPAANDSVTIYINWGDGNDTTFKSPYGASGYFSDYVPHLYNITGNFTIMCVATTSNNFTDTMYSNTLALTNTCSPVNGTLYVDVNSNCTYDVGEAVLSYHTVRIHDNTNNIDYFAGTNNSGQYATGVPPGNYTLSIYNPIGLTATCPASGSVTQTISGSATIDFGVSCNPSTVDMAVYAYASNWRPGFDRPLSLFVSSTDACGLSSGILTVTLPPELTYSSAYPGSVAPTTVSGNTLTWNVSNVSLFSAFWTTINVYTATTATMGDSLCITATITPAGADAIASNNVANLCAEVNNSMDPNDKHVSPQGYGAAGNIANGTELTYLVNFQNTGNDVAYTVTVKDMIDNDLDLSSFRVLRTSHPVNTTFVGREANFRFDNINLAAMSVNEAASKGYILYTIKPKTNLALGTTLNNTADIYFDYNDAIVTNTTLNTIAAPQSIQHISAGTMEASVFPNPANGNVYVEVNDKASFRAELYDMIGRSVRVMDGNNGKAAIDVKELPAGLYLLNLTNASNKVLSTKINIQH